VRRYATVATAALVALRRISQPETKHPGMRPQSLADGSRIMAWSVLNVEGNARDQKINNLMLRHVTRVYL
jgi:hypothetical protein